MLSVSSLRKLKKSKEAINISKVEVCRFVPTSVALPGLEV